MRILGYSCGLQSSLYTKNHRFTFNALIFCIEKFIDKKVDIDKISEDINVGESVPINVSPVTFKNVDFIENLSLK